MAIPVSIAEVSAGRDRPVLLDVRKDKARIASGLTIPGAAIRNSFAAETWWPEVIGHKVVVFCVHGHEVSQALAGFLADKGVDARYLEGGFEAWRLSGHDTVGLETGHAD